MSSRGHLRQLKIVTATARRGSFLQLGWPCPCRPDLWSNSPDQYIKQWYGAVSQVVTEGILLHLRRPTSPAKGWARRSFKAVLSAPRTHISCRCYSKWDWIPSVFRWLLCLALQRPRQRWARGACRSHISPHHDEPGTATSPPPPPSMTNDFPVLFG